MKRTLSAAISLGAVLTAACTGGDPESLRERASYAIGVDIANNIEQMQDDIDLDVLIQGLRDALSERDPRMDQEEMSQVLQEFFAQAQEDNAQRQREAMETNQQEGAAFLAANRSKEGVTETPSGLQYEILTQGDGPLPDSTNVVSVHYEGRLLDGKVFDSSYERGEPATFPLSGVIAGWTEGVQLMNVGSKFRFYIPGGLAYGERGRGADIGPNATLIFDVELLAIEQ